MIYLKMFETHSDYALYASSENFIKPNVSMCIQEEEAHFTPNTWADEYLTFEIISGGTIAWTKNGTMDNRIIYYSLNGGEWEEFYGAIPVNVGDIVRFKGDNPNYGKNIYDTYRFDDSTATFNLKGNIMSLITSSGFSDAKELTSNYTFFNLFSGTKVVDLENLILPATTLTNYCYSYMFYGCTNLTTAPKLPATTLANRCYEYMFYGCTRLTTAPELPATTLTAGCYDSMFYGCTNLNSITCLATNISASSCTYRWVNEVASSGTFIKDPSMTDWTRDYNGIPYNWAVQDAS